MFLQDKREELIEYGIKMLDNNLTVGTGGNLSICDRASE